MKYCKKDNDYITNINLDTERQEKKTVRSEVCLRLIHGEKLADIVTEHP